MRAWLGRTGGWTAQFAQRCELAAAHTVDRPLTHASTPAHSARYLGEVGDIVVGRVTEVGSKRWKVNVGGHKDAVLHLSAVNLPGGVQRMRTYEDQLQMRK